MEGSKPTLTAEYDDLVRRNKVLSDDTELVFLQFVEASRIYFSKFKGAEQEISRLQGEVVKLQTENNSLHMKLKNARQLLDGERSKRMLIEKDKIDLERQISLVVEMLGQGNINEETKEKLQVLSSTFSTMGHGTEGNRLSLREVLSPNHLSTIDEDRDTMGSIINVSEIDLTDGDELEEQSKTRSGRSFRSSSPCNKSGRKRKSSRSRSRSRSSGRRKATRALQEDKENFINIDGISEHAKIFSSAPPLSSDDGEIEGRSLTSFKVSAFNEIPVTPLRHHQQIPPKMQIATPLGGGTLYCSPGNSPLLRSHSNSKMNGRPHCFTSKTIYWSEFCQPCGKRFKFAKAAYKCRDCRATCHMECKDAVPLPCIPTMNTPGSKGSHFGTIVDYAPPVAPMVPAIIVHCTNEVESRGLNEVGIYRVPGSDREVKELRDRFLKGKGVPNLSNIDIHVICCTIKVFLRSLKEPLIPSTLWRDFISATEKTEKQDALAILYQAISDLPQPNRDTLAWIICHLQRVAECVECKMPVTNLARVFGPTLIGYSVADMKPLDLIEETRLQQKVMELLMEISSDYWKSFTDVPDESTPFSSKFPSPEKTCPSSNTRRKSILSFSSLPHRNERDMPGSRRGSKK